MVIDNHIILVFALILFLTKFCGIITKRIHLPQVVGALVAGVLLGPAVFNLAEHNETISVVADLGVIVLLFSAGMETDFKQLRSSVKSSALIAVAGVVLSIAGGFAAALFITGEPSFECFFIGVIIASTSASIGIEALHEMGRLKTKSASGIIGAAVIDDILGIVLLAVVLGLGEGGLSVASIAATLGKIILFFLFAIGAGFAANKLFGLINSKFGETRRLSIFALAFCFLMAYLAEQFGLSDITGAYIAGLALSSTRFVDYLEDKTNVLSYMLLSPVFFASIGLQVVFTGFNGKTAVFCGLLLLSALLSKLLGCGLGAKICGYSNRESVQIGAGMITRGEVSIIIAGRGIGAGLMDASLFSPIIAVVIITVLIAPVLLKAAFSK
ncbi:MAG: cation:proton antiporter [Oscillospiraceae bacterium]|nr:cation:proton antiporter [Oscillospiraceae bacterium]